MTTKDHKQALLSLHFANMDQTHKYSNNQLTLSVSQNFLNQGFFKKKFFLKEIRVSRFSTQKGVSRNTALTPLCNLHLMFLLMVCDNDSAFRYRATMLYNSRRENLCLVLCDCHLSTTCMAALIEEEKWQLIFRVFPKYYNNHDQK